MYPIRLARRLAPARAHRRRPLGRRRTRPHSRSGRPVRFVATEHLLVVEAGWATTIQDGGRPATPTSASRRAAPRRRRSTLVNRLVGNAVGAAVLETAGGWRLRAHGAAVVAVSTEAAVRTLSADEELTVPSRRPDVDVRRGAGRHRRGARARLAQPGLALGARAAAPSPDSLPVGPTPAPRSSSTRPRSRPRPVPVWPGPRVDRFAADALGGGAWTVSPDVSRVGVRSPVRACCVARRRAAQRGSVIGADPGAPRRPPVVMLADHPTTGGYPVIAV